MQDEQDFRIKNENDQKAFLTIKFKFWCKEWLPLRKAVSKERTEWNSSSKKAWEQSIAWSKVLKNKVRLIWVIRRL